MANGTLEARISYLEQIIIIIIIGGGFPGFPPKGDSFATDSSRLEALTRFGGSVPFPRPIGDPFSPDLARLSAIELESGVHQVNAELVRLKALEAQMQDRLKDVKTKSEGV